MTVALDGRQLGSVAVDAGSLQLHSLEAGVTNKHREVSAVLRWAMECKQPTLHLYIDYETHQPETERDKELTAFVPAEPTIVSIGLRHRIEQLAERRA